MLDHYGVRGGGFSLGIRPQRRHSRRDGVLAGLAALLNAAADLDALVYGARYAAELSESEAPENR